MRTLWHALARSGTLWHALARYAALCQEAGLVPVGEPEVLMSGNHSLARYCEVTEAVLQEVFEQLHRQRRKHCCNDRVAIRPPCRETTL